MSLSVLSKTRAGEFKYDMNYIKIVSSISFAMVFSFSIEYLTEIKRVGYFRFLILNIMAGRVRGKKETLY